MKIFITGSNGFIGKNLCEFYADNEVYRYTRGNLKLELSTFLPDVIIHCAAEIYKSDLMMDTNVLLTQEILDWLRTHTQTKMIHIGSSSEYGPSSIASSEQHRINPIDMYQATKGMATLLCQGYARTYALDIKIARPYSVYGRYEKPHRLFPRLWRAFQLDESMTLYNGVHDFIYINDFIDGINILLHVDKTNSGDIINFGSGKQYSNIEVLKLFETVTGKTAPIEHVSRMAKNFESNVWCCDTSYASKYYGFNCRYDLITGIKDFLETANYKDLT